MIVIGLMSGTSVDGIDTALYALEGAPPHHQVHLIEGVTVNYTDDLRQRILDACQPGTSTVDIISQLHFDLGAAFAGAVHTLLKLADFPLSQVDLIGSHGQTIWHQVNAEGAVTSTLQIGEASVIAERTGITTIANFRARDVAAGGQGAPLTSYIDWLLLRHPTDWRAVQNIGGMGNVTLLPPLNEPDASLLAFDTGPGNALIDAAVLELTGQHYDIDGRLALQGQVDEAWLQDLLQHPYFERQPPKTTGRELFGVQTARELLDEAHRRHIPALNVITTLTMLTAYSIADACVRFAPVQPTEMILGGGGSRNLALLSMLRDLLAPMAVKTHEDIGLNSDFKEALVFALLAYETWHGRISTLPEQTGASHASILGQITPGTNYTGLLQRTWQPIWQVD